MHHLQGGDRKARLLGRCSRRRIPGSLRSLPRTLQALPEARHAERHTDVPSDLIQRARLQIIAISVIIRRGRSGCALLTGLRICGGHRLHPRVQSSHLAVILARMRDIICRQSGVVLGKVEYGIRLPGGLVCSDRAAGGAPGGHAQNRPRSSALAPTPAPPHACTSPRNAH